MLVVRSWDPLVLTKEDRYLILHSDPVCGNKEKGYVDSANSVKKTQKTVWTDLLAQ